MVRFSEAAISVVKLGAMSARAAASFLGSDVVGVGAVVAVIAQSIIAHADAVEGNSAHLEEAKRRAITAVELTETLKDAQFDSECPAFGRLLAALSAVDEQAQKWAQSSRLSRSLALSSTGKSKATKYHRAFTLHFENLDRAERDLLSAVSVQSFGGIVAMQEAFATEANARRCALEAAAVPQEKHEKQGTTTDMLPEAQGASFEELLAAARSLSDELSATEDRLTSVMVELSADISGSVGVAATAAAASKAAEAAARALGSADSGDIAELRELIISELNAIKTEAGATRDEVGRVGGLLSTGQRNLQTAVETGRDATLDAVNRVGGDISAGHLASERRLLEAISSPRGAAASLEITSC